MTTNHEPETQPRYEGYIASDDIGYTAQGGGSITLEIASISEAGTERDASGKTVGSEVLHFVKAKKGLVLGKTNGRILRLLLGKDTAKWVGARVTLTVRFINAFSERDIPTIRVTPPDGLPLPFGVRKWMGRERPGMTLKSL
jgi:hypothetical protein